VWNYPLALSQDRRQSEWQAHCAQAARWTEAKDKTDVNTE